MKTKLFSVLLATLFAATSANAAIITVFSNESSYTNATLGDSVFLNFDGLFSIASNGVFPGVDFNTIGASNPDFVNLFEYVGDTGNPSTANNVGVLQGILSSPSYAIAMNILSGSIDGVNLFDSSNMLLGSATVNAGGFVGIVSDMAFSRFDFIPNVFSPGSNDRVYIDDFRISNPVSSVPNPSSIWLFIIALVGVAVFSQRKSKLISL